MAEHMRLHCVYIRRGLIEPDVKLVAARRDGDGDRKGEDGEGQVRAEDGHGGTQLPQHKRWGRSAEAEVVHHGSPLCLQAASPCPWLVTY